MNELPTVRRCRVEDRRIENDFPAEFSYFNVVIATLFGLFLARRYGD